MGKNSGWSIVQFNKDNRRYRLVSEALFDAVVVGDRLMEGVMFKVRLSEGVLAVIATDEAADYILEMHSSVSKWENDVLRYLLKNPLGYEGLCLDASVKDKKWDNDELHLTPDHTFYQTQSGLTLVP